MPLRPHLHLLVPSTTAGIHLEARVYLPHRDAVDHASILQLQLTNSSRSTPINPDGVQPAELEAALRARQPQRLIVAAHPWQKLGGNMLDPVLSPCLVDAALQDRSMGTAIVTFNVRGVGLSEGSMGLLGLSTTTNERDFAAVEEYFTKIWEPKEIRRVGYSWGSVLALNAMKSSPIPSTLLIAPPSGLFGVTTLLSSKTFSRALREARDVTIIHGTSDQFTSVSTFAALARDDGVQCWEVDGADHFFRDERSMTKLQELIHRWLAGA